MRRITLTLIPWNEEETPVRSRLEETLLEEGFEPFAWVDEPGKKYGTHSHPHDESIWVLRGDMTFSVDGKSYHLRPGDRLMLPRHAKHEAVAGPEGCEYLVGQGR